jgi:hypothetical protein
VIVIHVAQLRGAATSPWIVEQDGYTVSKHQNGITAEGEAWRRAFNLCGGTNEKILVATPTGAFEISPGVYPPHDA